MRAELNVQGIVLSEYDYVLPKTDWHYHENPYFMYVLRGDVFDLNKKDSTHCDAGSLIFHNWQEPHFNKSMSGLPRGFHIEFERSWYESHMLDVDLWEGSKKLEHPQIHQTIWKLIAEFKCSDEFSSLSIELLMLELCEQVNEDFSSSSACNPEWIFRLKDLIHQDSSSLSLKELSNKLGIHPAHLSRAVPRYLSTTLGDYMRQERLKKSLHHLLNTNYSLTEIAYLSGFSDQSHFSRTFRLYFKERPNEFRKKLLK